MVSLQTAYSDYIGTQVADSKFEQGLSSSKYRCWSIPHKQKYTVHNWLGEYIGTGVVQTKRYVWLGKKGAIYITKTPKFEKKSDGIIELAMKTWVWKNYFGIDFEEEDVYN